MRELPITLPTLKIATISVPEKMSPAEFDSLLATIQGWKEALVGVANGTTEKPLPPNEVDDE